MQESIYDYIANVSTKTYRRGDVVFSEGDLSDGKMYYLIEGSVSVNKQYNKGNKIIGFLHEGAFFGEMALVMSAERTATIIISSDKAKLGEINRETFKTLSKNYPGFLFSLLRSVIKNFGAAEERIRILELQKKLLLEGKKSIADEESYESSIQPTAKDDHHEEDGENPYKQALAKRKHSAP